MYFNFLILDILSAWRVSAELQLERQSERWGRPEFNATFSIGFGNGLIGIYRYRDIMSRYGVLRSRCGRGLRSLTVWLFNKSAGRPQFWQGSRCRSRFQMEVCAVQEIKLTGNLDFFHFVFQVLS